MPAINPHLILGTTPSSTKQEIRTAYRRRCLETHPDKTHTRTDFERVKSAYDALMNTSQQRCVITDELYLHEMDRLECGWSVDCRCGDAFVIEECPVQETVVLCGGCSLAILVYESEDCDKMDAGEGESGSDGEIEVSDTTEN